MTAIIITQSSPACEAKQYRKNDRACHGTLKQLSESFELQLQTRPGNLVQLQKRHRAWMVNLLAECLSCFTLYGLSLFGIALLLIPTLAWTQPREAAAEPILVAKVEQDVGVYTNMNRFMENRLKKLQTIIKRARAAQQKIRAEQARRSSPNHQKSLQTWKNIERRAQAMMADINRTLDAKKQKAARRRVHKSITLTRMDGGREQMATHRGAVVLLHFWATWCRPCIKEIDVLDTIHHRFRNQNFKVVAVSLDARRKDVKHFMSRRNLQFPVYMDSGRTIYQQIIGGAEVLPRSLLINQKGQIVHTYAGAQHLETLAESADIRRLLARP